MSYEFFSYDRHDRYNDKTTVDMLKIVIIIKIINSSLSILLLLSYTPKYKINIKLFADAIYGKVLPVQTHLGKQV